MQNDEFFEDENEDFENESELETKEAEILSETKAEIITEIDDKAKELSGISALLANLPQDSDVSIIVTRLNDRQYKNQFRLPSQVDSKLETINWDGSPYPDSMYEYIQRKYGGGHYRFQLRYGTGFGEAWKDVLADPAEFSEQEKLLHEREMRKIDAVKSEAPISPPVVDDSFDKFMQQFEKLERFKQAISPPAPVVVETNHSAITKESIKMALIERSMSNPALLEQALQAVFDISPRETVESQPKGFFESLLSTFAESPVLQQKVSDLISGGISLLTTPQSPPISPAVSPAVGLDAFRAKPAETQQTPLVVAESERLPVVELGD